LLDGGAGIQRFVDGVAEPAAEPDDCQENEESDDTCEASHDTLLVWELLYNYSTLLGILSNRKFVIK